MNDNSNNLSDEERAKLNKSIVSGEHYDYKVKPSVTKNYDYKVKPSVTKNYDYKEKASDNEDEKKFNSGYYISVFLFAFICLLCTANIVFFITILAIAGISTVLGKNFFKIVGIGLLVCFLIVVITFGVCFVSFL